MQNSIVLVGLALMFVASQLALADDGERWVAAWQGSPTPGGTFYSPGCPSDVGLSGQTVRNIVFLSAGGDAVRVRLSNAGGVNPLMVGSASVAISNGGAAAVAGSVQALSFAGRSSILIAAGGEVVSDPVPMSVQPMATLAVSVYLPGSTGLATQHYFAAQTNYLAAATPPGRLPPRRSHRQSLAGCSFPAST